jgi:hypothetical protein
MAGGGGDDGRTSMLAAIQWSTEVEKRKTALGS